MTILTKLLAKADYEPKLSTISCSMVRGGTSANAFSAIFQAVMQISSCHALFNRLPDLVKSMDNASTIPMFSIDCRVENYDDFASYFGLESNFSVSGK